MKTLFLVTLVVILAAIVPPLTAEASRDPYFTDLGLRSNDEFLERRGSYSDDYGGSSPSSYVPGNYNSSTSADYRGDSEGFALAGSFNLGRGNSIGGVYTKSSQKGKVNTRTRSSNSVGQTEPRRGSGPTVVEFTGPSQTWLVNAETGHPIRRIVIDEKIDIRPFKSEIAVDRGKREIVRYKVQNITNDLNDVVIPKGKKDVPHEGDSMIFVFIKSGEGTPQDGDTLRIRQ